jgi:hypothetical protein
MRFELGRLEQGLFFELQQLQHALELSWDLLQVDQRTFTKFSKVHANRFGCDLRLD